MAHDVRSDLAATGKQAFISPDKLRWWSRPLVAALFLLQPIVRGWARYRERLRPQNTPSPQPSLESQALVHNKAPLDEACYWSENRVDRVQFVADLLKRLDEMGWPNKSDIGWSEFDIELFGNRWNRVQLTTASEDHHQGRSLLRARLRPRWTLEARVVFWALIVSEIVVLSFVPGWTPWRWLLLSSALPLVWFIRRQARHLQSMAAVLLDEMALAWKLTKLGAAPAREEAPPRRALG